MFVSLNAICQTSTAPKSLTGYFSIFNKYGVKTREGILNNNELIDGRTFSYNPDNTIKATHIYKGGLYVGDLGQSITADTINQRYLRYELARFKNILKFEEAGIEDLKAKPKSEEINKQIEFAEKNIKDIKSAMIETEKQIK